MVQKKSAQAFALHFLHVPRATMPPFEKWRQEMNEKFDRLGEEPLNKLRGSRAMKSSYEDRLASIRGTGSAAETMAGTSQHRHMPPLPPDMAPMPQTHTVPASTASAGAPTGPAPAYAPPSTTHIAYSQFTEADKQAFFALLDEVRWRVSHQYFGKRTGASDMW